MFLLPFVVIKYCNSDYYGRCLRMEQEFKFNPINYAHLDKASLEKYIFEILIRNDAFLKEAKQRLTSNLTPGKADEDIEFFKKYKIFIFCKDKEKDLVIDNINITLPNAVSEVHILPRDNDIEDNEKVRHGYYSKGLHKDQVYEAMYLLLEDYDQDGYYPWGDTLLLRVNLERSKEEIEKNLEDILKTYKKRRTSSQRLDKWKYYIIVYDLRKKQMTFKEIADILSTAYPDNKNLFDERNVEGYYDKACKLISGEYKKYI